MDRCYYYLSNGLWKIVEKYFDPSKKIENDYFWGMAVQPNYNSFGSHIISTPWQQSWITMDILESFQQNLEENEKGNDVPGVSEMNILRREVNFQYTLRNYSSDSFVQQLFSIYTKIQTHLIVNYTESEIKAYNTKLKMLLKVLVQECPSSAHTLLSLMLQHSFFVTCCESLVNEVEGDDLLCSLIVHGLCETEMIQFHLPFVVNLLQTPFRFNLCLLLLASDNISLLQLMIEEDKKLFKSNSRARLQNIVENGLKPLESFSEMIIMERHFFLQLLDLINTHLDEFEIISKSTNIPSFVWPLILLQNWNNSSLPEETLLLIIEKCKESTRDKTIIQITYILEWYINFCKWYERHEAAEQKEQRADNNLNLLEKAKEHSVLYLINNTTDLSETDWSQIRDLLKQGKSDVVKTWDLILFDGYCILMLVLRTIIISTEIDHAAKAQKVKLNDITILNDTFRALYDEEVTEKLKTVKKILLSLYPLTFRLEILENIFALIFITYEDVKKLSYYLNGVVKFEKYIDKSQARSKSVPVEKSSSSKSGRSSSLPAASILIPPEKGEEEGACKKLKQKGFMCKKYIVRDLIYLVKECLERLEEDPGGNSNESSVDVPCSIKISQMENRLDRLSESVSEATWRLQLVTDPDFISQIGCMHFACGQDPYHHFDGEWIYLPHDFDRSGLLKAKKKSSEKPNDSGSQSHSSPGNGNSNNEFQNVKLKAPGPAIMNQMLACDSSLVVQCLSQGDVLNADHIIQMMSTEENRQNLEGELNFTRAVNDLKKKLQNISLESPARKSCTDTVSKSRSLQSIQMIANQGVSSTALTNHVERFLSAYTLPSIQSHSKVSAGSVLQCIENTTAMVTIDLALTTAMSFQDFKDLLNIASKHCPELNTRVQSPISAQTTSTKPLGYIIFSQNLIALLQEVNRSQINDFDLEISLHRFLRSHQYPFSLKSLKDNINFWKHLKLAFSDFEKNTKESCTLMKYKEGVLTKCQKNIKDMQKIFESVTKLAESCNEFMDLGKFEASSGEMAKSVNYIDLLSKYLSDLSVFILENVSSKTGELPEPVTLHCLLEESAVDIVDKLIFEHCIEPGVLEKKAQQLGFNLSASLIAGCCPKLPQIGFLADSSKCSSSDRIILNEVVADCKPLPTLHPNQVVESILSELLRAFETFMRNKQSDLNIPERLKNVVNEADLLELRNDIKIQKILEKTLEINFVELKGLKGDEILVFLINLLNLMVCHCYLSTKLEKNDGIYSKYTFFQDVGFVFLGYNVGELGFLSISDLRTKIIGKGFFKKFFCSSQEIWSSLQVTPDPRLIFTTVNFRSNSPALHLFSPDNLTEQIDKAVDSYIQYNVFVLENSVVISDLLEVFLNNMLLKSKDLESESLNSNKKLKIYLKFLIEHSSGELQKQLSAIAVSEATLEVGSPKNEIMLKLVNEHNCFEKAAGEILEEKWLNRRLSDSILRHFSQSSRILADIVQKIHEAKEPAQTEVARDVLTEEKLKYLDLLFSASWLQHVAPLFNYNTVITALSKFPQEPQIANYFENCSLNCDWSKCLDIIFALPDYYVFSDLNIRRFKDIALQQMSILASEEGQESPWYYSEHISDINIRIETAVYCCKQWPGLVCVTQFSSILRDNQLLSSKQRNEIMCLISKIKVYSMIQEVLPEIDAKTWFDVCTIADSNPYFIIKNLVKNNQLELCLQWINLPGILGTVQQFVDVDFILLFFDHLTEDFELVDQLVDSLPTSKLSEIYAEVIFKLTSVPSICHLVQRAIALDSSPRYRSVEISLQFLYLLEPEEQSQLVHLKSFPLLILEQLLMNTKVDALEKVLKKARQIPDGELISQEEINKLIVFYASKAVEFDLVKAVKNIEAKQIFMPGSPGQTSQEQLIPPEVPDKSQWVPDNTVSLCMCCRLVSFSMFNRRHHCRRCGRVVCGTCSCRKMKVNNLYCYFCFGSSANVLIRTVSSGFWGIATVSGYRGVAVRVCQNCYIHLTKSDSDTKYSQSTDVFDGSSYNPDVQYWKLSTDPSKNATVREEFSYEHSPNVALCLAIFNLLPDATYSSVLLKESEKMLRILQLNGKSGNSEVDYGVVIQIIRSLIVGAKVKYGQAGLISGVDCCDELLSQVDLLQLLINNHCSSLIPSEPLNGTTLRWLRDKLVEEEMWELAMEVSTKCGLDRNGVWAAWGKVCLSSGSWGEARNKFSHCLSSSPKPARNPPLLDEICRILESATYCLSMKGAQKQTEKGVVPQEVYQVLSTLKHLSQGKSLTFSAIPAKNSAQYEEEVFYLTTYGSHQALLSFYLKHDELKTAFIYLLQQQLEPEIFLDSLLLPSYKSDQHEKFKFEMLVVDPSLESFKKYLIHSCLFLQRCGYLHTLHDIQIVMQDFLRAAVTCIHLYQKNATCFADLVSRSSHLHAALKCLEDELSVMSKKTKRLDYVMKMDAKKINRHINTIWRQMEAAKFLAVCESKDKFIPSDIFPNDAAAKENEMPTLFDGNPQRELLVKLIIVLGKSISEGFGIAFRIIQDHQLDSQSLFASIGKKLAEESRINDIKSLVECLKTSGSAEMTAVVDHLISASIPILSRNETHSSELEALSKLIRDVDLRISAFIETSQLVPAYILAGKHNRLEHIQRIMEIADQRGLTIIKKICMAKLNVTESGSNEEGGSVGSSADSS